jgi:hypothetical protein
MRARRRIGLGTLASGTLHAAAAGAALWLGAGDRTDEPEAELVWADIELIEEAPTASPVLDPGAPTAPVNRLPPPARKSDTGRIRDASATRARPPAARAATRSGSDPGAESASVIDSATGGEERPATEPGAASDSGAGAESPARGPPDLDPRRAAAGIELDPGPPPPPGVLDRLRLRKPPRPRSELRPAGPDGFVTAEGTFVARTDRDGRVAFDDGSPVRIDLPTPRDAARGVERWAEDPRRYAEDSGDRNPIGVGGSFDLTDSIMRQSGEEPYSARKMAFLDRTRAERMQIAARENSQRLRDSLQDTRAHLDGLWRGRGSAAHKRRLLFLLWDECAETGSDEVVHAARAVRGQIIAFVRRHLPAGSRLAYTKAELARHNARRSSRERFDPYAPRD